MAARTFLTTTLFAIATASMTPGIASADAIGGAAIGAGAGALVGHAVSGRDGALVGGALGAVAGASIGAHHSRAHRHRYYRNGHVYYRTYPPTHVHRRYSPARAYYAPAVYANPAPVYYAHPVVHRGHRHVHYRHDRHGRLVRYYTWR